MITIREGLSTAIFAGALFLDYWWANIHIPEPSLSLVEEWIACHALHPPDSAMTGNHSTLGVCPLCEIRIPATLLLIEYEKDNGNHAVFAECPDCENVVQPK